ncbi:hypothetical protein CAOG_009781 [Capsaspora owczarzaki ATCC 30864]|uniref:DUF5679 domain-containing protein n=1 Tax=Capsaspora owczarzaki (strain ATCC 30864) TaxID=595528 RepID=A0A0D2WQL3_CAPO3|nr:hypothetical protein CAOG_009781 [Capsaspora owczarzaki ATCC 30864]
MSQTFCVKCQKKTADVGSQLVTGGRTPRLASTCGVCGGKKSAFVSSTPTKSGGHIYTVNEFNRFLTGRNVFDGFTAYYISRRLGVRAIVNEKIRFVTVFIRNGHSRVLPI